MKIPFFKRARMTSTSVTDRLVQSMVKAAISPGVPANRSAGIQIAANIYSSALSGAKVTGIDLPPEFLGEVGRRLITDGEAVYAINLDRSLTSILQYEVTGGVEEASWVYKVEIPSPSNTITKIIPRAGLLHFRWVRDRKQPWRGRGPADLAASMGALAIRSEVTMEKNHSASQVYLVPFTKDARSDFDYNSELIDLIEQGKGRTAPFEFMPDNTFKDENSRAANLKNVRISPEPRQESLLIGKWADISICEVAGIQAPLVTDSSDGTSRREAWRMFLTAQLTPLVKRIAYELNRGLETSPDFS